MLLLLLLLLVDGFTPVFMLDKGRNELEEELFKLVGLESTTPFESFKWLRLDADGLARPAPCMLMFLSSSRFVDISIEE